MRGVLALLLVGGAILLFVVGTRRERLIAERERRWSLVPPSPVPPGWTDVGTDATLLRRLGLRELFDRRANATDVRTTTLGTYEVVAAVTSGSGWINERHGSMMVARVPDVSHTMCALRLRGPLPTFNLIGEGATGAMIGEPDLDTEFGEFNRTRRVVAADDRLAHALLAPSVIAAMHDGPQDVTLQVLGDQLVSFRLGRLDQAEVETRLAWMVRVADAIPAFVYDEAIPTSLDDVEMPSFFDSDPPKHRWSPPASET